MPLEIKNYMKQSKIFLVLLLFTTVLNHPVLGDEDDDEKDKANDKGNEDEKGNDDEKGMEEEKGKEEEKEKEKGDEAGKPEDDDVTLNRLVVDDKTKPAIFGSHFFDVISLEFETKHKKAEVSENPGKAEDPEDVTDKPEEDTGAPAEASENEEPETEKPAEKEPEADEENPEDAGRSRLSKKKKAENKVKKHKRKGAKKNKKED